MNFFLCPVLFFPACTQFKCDGTSHKPPRIVFSVSLNYKSLKIEVVVFKALVCYCTPTFCVYFFL